MKKKKTLKQLLKEPYLSKTEIADLFGLPYGVAVKVFNLAREEDKAKLKGRIIYEYKVLMSSVLSVQGISYTMLERQIKGAPER